MSFNVGDGWVTSHINSTRLYEVSKRKELPEITLWEKIKHFFFSTGYKEAVKCIHKLYHHQDYNMSDLEIRDVFTTLQHLASPGCKHKFSISSNDSLDEYIIDGEIILSRPRLGRHNLLQDSEEEVWYDCEGDDRWSVATDNDLSVVSARQVNIPVITESNETAYVQSIVTIVPLIEQRLRNIGAMKLGWTLGSDSAKAYKLANSIKEKIESKVSDKQTFKKDIDALIAIPGIIKLLPDELINMPEFILVKNG
ncbi:hypothetical protein [uncultured Cedecea sp.]|uniref:hypothetical protein n=1 Tax=uncultured Cedecea sp. TaxID=988762 RepID=UPI00261DE430|nr:hypothetical protein [uncultured Cedecea sp.]